MTKVFVLFEKYMYVIGSASSMVFYLQAYKIFMEKSASDVSLAAFSFGLVSVLSWLIYGLILKNKVLIVANTLAVVGASLAVTGIVFYR